ncbi:hypothetical protein FOZ62_009430 [Perkinsus olseni]|uniref:Uncharacterized protein n=1 Tax=Perkinsus olseni TaxID=32597 RepID=A0A7J6UGJ7_PEROL|nr:hypothetical protein FOZ62_009430 [Perkinsus olseni]
MVQESIPSFRIAFSNDPTVSSRPVSLNALLDRCSRQLSRHRYEIRPYQEVLYHNQWIKNHHDVSKVPEEVLEGWGIPLKLIKALKEQVRDIEVTAIRSDFVARLQILGDRKSKRKKAMEKLKKRHKEKWAAVTIAECYKRYLMRRDGHVLVYRPDDEDGEFRDGPDFYEQASTMSWSMGDGPRPILTHRSSVSSAASSSTASYKVARRTIMLAVSRWILRVLKRRRKAANETCPLAKAIQKILVEKDIRPDLGGPIRDWLVGRQWLLTVEDLGIVEERHWLKWNSENKIPWGMVMHLKELYSTKLTERMLNKLPDSIRDRVLSSSAWVKLMPTRKNSMMSSWLRGVVRWINPDSWAAVVIQRAVRPWLMTRRPKMWAEERERCSLERLFGVRPCPFEDTRSIADNYVVCLEKDSEKGGRW